MDNKVLLSITVLTAITCSGHAYASSASTAAPVHQDVKAKSAGCAKGKCGAIKQFEEVAVLYDPQDKLVYARDGKCGINNHSLRPTKPGKCASGLCGNTE